MKKNIENNDISTPETVAERIKHIRKRAKYTQADFADSIGIKQSTLSDIERGKIGASTNIVSKISDTYYVSADWILTGKESLYIPKNGGLINVEKINNLYNKENIVKSDNLTSNEIDISRGLNMIIHNNLRTIETHLFPLIDELSKIIPSEEIGDNRLFLQEKEYLMNLFFKYPAKQSYQNLPIDDKLRLIGGIDYSLNVIMEEASRLTAIIEKLSLKKK
jgi:transcriptional regulator with XRE-family HTH domain